jgi:hypothetical protein
MPHDPKETIMGIDRNRLALLGSVTALALGSLGATALAKNGADDPPGHDRGDDHGGKVERVHHHRHHVRAHAARHGADDPAGHDRGDDRGAR